MTTTIHLLKHVQDGRERLYPGCALSRVIPPITGRKTLSESDVNALHAVWKCEIEIELVKKCPAEPKMASKK